MKSIERHLICLALAAVSVSAEAGVVGGLRTEYMDSPVGVDAARPRFSWVMEDGREGSGQKDARVLVGEDSLQMSREYCLKPLTRYYWKVVCKDMDGKDVESRTATFVTGKMSGENWRGSWISDDRDKDFRPAPRFRKEFDLGAGEIKEAYACIAVAGLYTLNINGEKVGDRILDPAFTRYDRRVLYCTYDITGCLKNGNNAVGVELGNGWYNHQPKTTWHFEKAPWRNRPAFCMDIVVRYKDGSEQIICTGTDWKTSSDGPQIYNNVYTGERYDARREQIGWAEAGYDDLCWNDVILRGCPAPVVSSQLMAPIRESEEIEAVALTQLRPNKWIFDFGVNMSGNAHVRISGNPGTTITLKYAERLSKEGRADQSNIDIYYFDDKGAEPFQTDVITLGKDGVDFHPQYSYKGFRYIEVTSSKAMEIGKDNIRAVAVHSDVPSIGEIKCSNSLVCNIENAARNSYLSNLMGYPTDCPQREKNGWTADAHLAIETGLYNFDAFTVYEKWMADHRDEQQPNGVLPDIIPTCGWGYWNTSGDGNGLDWTSSIALIPWNLYLFYGDAKPLMDCYDNIKRYVEYALTLCDSDCLTRWGRGDWVPVTKKGDKTLICSCFLYKDLEILSRTASMMGKDEDGAKYAALAQKVKDSINARFLDKASGIYAGGMQTELSLPLVMGVVPEESRAQVAKALAAKVAQDKYHINAGVHGAKAVLTALSENGYGEAAYKIATSTDFPSWGYWLTNGRTSLVENWRLDAQKDNSDNHIMFGDVAAWFYRSLGGINPDPENPGFKHIILRPAFPKGLKDFECSYRSPYGKISIKWERKGNTVRYNAVIPCGCSATLVRNDGSAEELACGTYLLTIKL